jgi:L-glutamine:2-deoxy-scyllo-inosose/3-amino-2,3-dideoxy-scyllo-inosose aminotransferase
LALEACGIGWGDEVIVPGLTWQATAASVLDVNATPILVDVCEDTWCMDPDAVRKAITPRTKAIMPVHLYDGYANMDAILDIARQHNLRVIEDCAHKHGGAWGDQKAGSMGDIGSFSFQLSKLMTAGEGGALTTNSAELNEKLDALRNCGRRPEPQPAEDQGAGFYGDDGNFIQSGNYRLTDFQAAILTEQLKRLPEQNQIRGQNAAYLNQALRELPGVEPMNHMPKEQLGACFNFSFRYNQAQCKNIPAARFREAFMKEVGFEVEACYEPLNQCSLYTPHTKPSRYHLSQQHWEQVNPARFSLPVCDWVYKTGSVCFHHAMMLGSQSDMDDIIHAIQKIYDNASELQ